MPPAFVCLRWCCCLVCISRKSVPAKKRWDFRWRYNDTPRRQTRVCISLQPGDGDATMDRKKNSEQTSFIAQQGCDTPTRRCAFAPEHINIFRLCAVNPICARPCAIVFCYRSGEECSRALHCRVVRQRDSVFKVGPPGNR